MSVERRRVKEPKPSQEMAEGRKTHREWQNVKKEIDEMEEIGRRKKPKQGARN
jgi:predicted transcriptional regulator